MPIINELRVPGTFKSFAVANILSRAIFFCKHKLVAVFIKEINDLLIELNN